MCVASMTMSHYQNKWRQPPYSFYPRPMGQHPRPPYPQQSPITPAEIAEFRELLHRAREYDIKNNEPECDLEEKRADLLALAREFGVYDAVLAALDEPPAADAVDPQVTDSGKPSTRV
jgi:hypothetical protein